MKTFNIFIISLGIAGIFLMSSCSNFLKEDPYSYVGIEDVGNDDDAVNLWVTGVYSKWLDDMARWGNFPRLLDMDCDYVSGPDWAFSNLGAGNFQGDEVPNTLWNGCYNLINRANVAIERVSQITGANEGASYNQPRRSIKEVYDEIIRLLEVEAIPRLYKNTDASYQVGHVCAGTAVALLSKVYVTMAAAAMPSGAEITVMSGSSYKFEKDTKKLVKPIPLTFTKKVVAGYEVFDYNKCYQEAAKWAGYLINHSSEHDYGQYGLLQYKDLWTKSGYDKVGNGQEHLFTLRTRNGDEVYSSGILEWYNGIDKGNGVVQNGLYIGNRYHWYCLFDSEDYRIVDGVKHRFILSYQDENENNKGGFYYPQELKLQATGYDENGNKVADPVAPFNDGRNYYYNVSNECLAFTNKYSDVTDLTQKYSDAYYPFLRMADVYLIYAEAKCELDEYNEAINALNDVRDRSNANRYTFSNKNDLRSKILEERAKELTLEGDRRWDLIRWGIYVDVMNSITGTNNDGTVASYDEAGISKRRDERHLLFPLPTSEVSTNEAIDSNNPGWN